MEEWGLVGVGARNIHRENLPPGLLGHIWGRPLFGLGFRNVLCTKPCIGHICGWVYL